MEIKVISLILSAFSLGFSTASLIFSLATSSLHDGNDHRDKSDQDADNRKPKSGS